VVRARVLTSIALLVGSLGCDPQPGETRAALEPSLPPARGLEAGEVLLDERADARLIARIVPAPENADPERWLHARIERDGRTEAIDGRVLDARFVGDGIVVVDEAHELRVLGGQVLDHAVEPPLSVRGSRVAYVRGEMPFFEVALADVASGSARALTEGYAPTWSPALDTDGSVVFVSSREGRPRLHRVSPTGQVVALPESTRSPSSPRAPRLEGGRLVFEDELGVATLELATGRVIEGSAP